MAINFPSTAGQATDGSYTYTVAGITYSWDGSSWRAAGAGASATDKTLFSVTTNAAGTAALSYNSNTGVFSYTPPDLSSYLTAEADTLATVTARGSTTTNNLSVGGLGLGTVTNLFDFSQTNWTSVDNSIILGNDLAIFHMQDGTFGTSNRILAKNNNLVIGTQGATGSSYNYTTLITVDVGNDAYSSNTSHVKLGHAQAGTVLETTATGVTITGALTAGGLTYPTSNGTSGQALISDGAGNVNWGSVATTGLQSRTTAQVTQSITAGAAANVTFTTPKAYALMSIQTNVAAWVTLYSDTASRTNDASRSETTDPTPGSGVLAEVITTGSATQLITPGTICFNSSPTTATYAKIVNKSGSTTNVTVTLTFVQIEA